MQYKAGSFEECVRLIVIDVLTNSLQNAHSRAPKIEGPSFVEPKIKRKYTFKSKLKGRVTNPKDKRLKKNREANA